MDYVYAPTVIPFADLPTFADTAILLSLLLGSASLLLLLGLDAWHSRCKKTHWIRGNSLVLGALSLQLLGLLSHPAVNISDSQKLNQDSLDKMITLIMRRNLFLALSGRAVTCVFIGNMLPDVARSHEHNVWSNMIALSISATGVLIHLCYENFIFIVWYGYLDYMAVLYLGTNIIIFASIALLVLFLGCAALSSKSIHEVVAQRIPVLLSRSEYRNPRSVVSWKAFEEQAVRSWITARTCQPDYIIARSVLSSSIAFLVTICVVFCLGFSILGWVATETFVVSGYRDDWLRSIAVAVQWVFVLVGWAMVSWRWLTAVVFFPRRMGKNALSLKQYFFVEDFWKRALLELHEEFIEWDVESIKSSSLLHKFLLMFIQKVRLYKLLLVLLYVQILLVFMSKTCWLISEIVLSNHLMRRILMGRFSHDFPVLYNLHNSSGLIELGNDGDFVEYLDSLMYMLGENPAGLWIANLKSIELLKLRLTEAESHGKNCKALISLLEKTTRQGSVPFAICQRNLQVEKDFNMGKSSAKMTVVSLVTIIIQLSAFYQEYGKSIACPAIDTVEHCIAACCEAWGIMDLVENSDPEVAMVSKQADRLFHNLKKSHKWLGLPLPISKFEAKTVEAAKEALQELIDIGKQMANGGCISSAGYDSKNWKAVIAGNNLYRLCESIKNCSGNIKEMLDVIESSLAYVIGSCLFKVEEIIVDQCRLSAEAFMEEKLWDVFYEAWKAKGVIQQLPPGIKFGRSFPFQFEKIHSF